MSNARSPRDVCSTTMGINAMGSLNQARSRKNHFPSSICHLSFVHWFVSYQMSNDKCEMKNGKLFRLLLFFFPFFVGHVRVGDQNVERLAIAQPPRDATFAILLCQDTTHLFGRLSRGVGDRVDLVVDLFFADFDL